MNTVISLLNEATRQFKQSGIEDAGLEARYLVPGLLGITTTDSFVWPERTIGTDEAIKFRSLVSRRCAHEPAAYIRGVREFYGRNFMVDGRVLIPRPETELLVELAINHVRRMSRSAKLTDVGTGSGNIAITLALELPESVVTAIDISEDALDVAMTNAVKYNVGNVRFLVGDLLAPVSSLSDVIVANLPYIRDDDYDSLPPEILNYEPSLALKGGCDGFRLVERLIAQAGKALDCGGIMLLEVGARHHTMVNDVVSRYYPEYNVESHRDLNGLERVIKIKLSK